MGAPTAAAAGIPYTGRMRVPSGTQPSWGAPTCAKAELIENKAAPKQHAASSNRGRILGSSDAGGSGREHNGGRGRSAATAARVSGDNRSRRGRASGDAQNNRQFGGETETRESGSG